MFLQQYIYPYAESFFSLLKTFDNNSKSTINSHKYNQIESLYYIIYLILLLYIFITYYFNFNILYNNKFEDAIIRYDVISPRSEDKKNIDNYIDLIKNNINSYLISLYILNILIVSLFLLSKLYNIFVAHTIDGYIDGYEKLKELGIYLFLFSLLYGISRYIFLLMKYCKKQTEKYIPKKIYKEKLLYYNELNYSFIIYTLLVNILLFLLMLYGVVSIDDFWGRVIIFSFSVFVLVIVTFILYLQNPKLFKEL